jgi:thiamine phosphate synthase YjbQ (UPF0047 family)
MRETIRFWSGEREELIEITEAVRRIVQSSGMRVGIGALCARGATAAIMIHEKWDSIMSGCCVEPVAPPDFTSRVGA